MTERSLPSLSTRLIVRLSLAIGTVSMVVCLLYVIVSAKTEGNRLAAEADVTVGNIAATLEKSLWDFDTPHVIFIGTLFSKNSLISQLSIRDAEGTRLYFFQREGDELGIARQATVLHDQAKIGTVEAVFTQRFYYAGLWNVIQTTAITAIILIGVLFLVTGHLVRRLLRTPIEQLSRTVEAYEAENGPSILVDSDLVEFRAFSQTLSTMGSRIRQQIGDLRSLNASLQTKNIALVHLESELREREQRIRSIADNFPNGMIYQLVIARDGTRHFTYLSDSVRQLYGIAPEDGLRDPMLIYGRLHEDDRQAVTLAEAAAIESLSVFRHEVRIREPSGSIRWSSLVSTPRLMPDGSTRWDGIEFVITASKMAEAELLRHRDHLEELVEQRTSELKREQARIEQYFTVATSLTVVLNLQGNIVRINPYGCELLGWKPEELIGRNWFRTCLPPDSCEAVYQYFLSFVADVSNLGAASFTANSYDNDVVTRSGEIRRLLFRNAWVRGENDRVIGTLSSAIDITVVREAQTALLRAKELAERANQAKSTFLANMSHEIRTPLNAVLGYAQILDRSATISDEHRKAVQVINRSGEHLLQLINDILEMSRIESGHSTCEMEDFDLPGLLDNLKSLFLQRIQDKGLILDVSPSGPPPQYLRTDARKLRQILINLLSNAVKFTSHGSLSILATVNAGRLTIAVRDTGAGIAPAALGQLFQPFVQADEGRRRGDGTGLGLAISQGFARLLGGSLTVASTVGSGSVFTLDIPVETATGAIRQPARGHVVGLAPGQRAPRLLIAEDRAESRDLLVELMQSTGCHVEAVTNGAEAVSACQRARPDLIWMDIDMPVLDGLSAAIAIRALPGPPPMIVALTAAAFNEDRARILAGGCDEMTSKPFREEELFRIMERLLGIHFTWKRASPLPVATTMLSDAELRRRLLTMPQAERTHFAYTMETGDIHACSQILSTWTDRDLATAISTMLSTYALDRILGLLEEKKP